MLPRGHRRPGASQWGEGAKGTVGRDGGVQRAHRKVHRDTGPVLTSVCHAVLLPTLWSPGPWSFPLTPKTVPAPPDLSLPVLPASWGSGP